MARKLKLIGSSSRPSIIYRKGKFYRGYATMGKKKKYFAVGHGRKFAIKKKQMHKLY